MKYNSLNAVKIDYPIGKVQIQGEEQIYSCNENSFNWNYFIERWNNNPFAKITKDKNHNTVAVVSYPKVKYSVFDYGYIASKDMWFPITDYTNFEDIIYVSEEYEDKYVYPPTYKEVITSIKKSNITILSNTVEE